MMDITLTTWNAEWWELIAGVDLGWVAPGKRTFIDNAPTKKEAHSGCGLCPRSG